MSLFLRLFALLCLASLVAWGGYCGFVAIMNYFATEASFLK